MKLKELIERIDIDAIIADERSTILERSIFYAVGVDTADLNYDRLDEQRRLFCNHIITWYCTDSWVGLMVYVFDREVVALSKQIGRKYDREFGWVSQDAYDKVKEFCYSFIEQEKDEARIIDFEEDIGADYSVSFASQLIKSVHKEARLNGELVKALDDADKSNYISTTVNVEHSDGRITAEKLEDLKFPFMMLKE